MSLIDSSLDRSKLNYDVIIVYIVTNCRATQHDERHNNWKYSTIGLSD